LLQTIQEFAKKYGIWAALFISLLLWVINGYERRECEYVAHEKEYHRIIADNTKVMQDSQTLMKDSQQNLKENTELMKGYKMILDVKLDQISSELEKLRQGR
jgi:hypothetical protein